MESNIKFKSNVYPISKSIHTDMKFLSKIFDHDLLKKLDENYFSYKSKEVWTEMQLKIIEEVPTCSLDKLKDPCWGLMRNEGGYYWGCKCLNLRCKYFTKCRDSFEEIELDHFLPKNPIDRRNGYSSYIPSNSNNKLENDDDQLYSSDYYNYYSGTNKNSDYKIYEINEKDEEHEMDEIDILNYLDDEECKNKLNLSDQKKIYEIGLKDNDENCNNIIEDLSREEDTEERINVKEDSLGNIILNFKPVEQEAIIAARCNEVLFVDAGPGTGKTYTLIKRIISLVTEQDTNPEGILVLCFTNAAVDEIRLRLRSVIDNGGDRGLANVDIRTFHSFAWWLIHQSNDIFSEDGWETIDTKSLTFDMSIKLATKAMIDFGEYIVDNWENFIVDEVQDLTSHLAKFVLAIVDECLNINCGITFFGDSCQAIYDYSQNHNKDSYTSEEFYQDLYDKIIENATFAKLIKNHRQSPVLIKTTLGLRRAIEEKNVVGMKDAVKDASRSIPNFRTKASLPDGSELETISKNKRTCILFRNNGQTLRMSSNLRKMGVEHTVNTTDNSQNFAPWIADVFFDCRKPEISLDEFTQRYNSSVTKLLGVGPVQIWERFQFILHRRDNILKIRDVLDAIGTSKIDDPVFRNKNNSKIVVSNIHRSKGREYENVIIDKDFVDKLIEKEKTIGEYKTLYVGLTRAKESLLALPLNDSKSLYPIQIYATGRKRWGRAKHKRIAYFEFDSSIDLDPEEFAFQDQNYLSKIKVGDPIEFRRLINGSILNYSIIHNPDNNGKQIGYIGKTYIQDLQSYLKISSNNLIDMPCAIDTLYVAGVYSHIVNTDDIEMKPELKKVAPNGIWKKVDIVGAGHASYDTY